MSKIQSVKFLSAQEELEYAKLAAAGDKGAKEKLWSAINGLKPEEREVVILHYGLKTRKNIPFQKSEQ